MESKSKIQQMVIDCLALILDISPDRQKTEQLIQRHLGETDKAAQRPDAGYSVLNQIRQRQNKDYLPAMQLDGTVEFKPPGIISDVLPTSPSKPTAQEVRKPDQAANTIAEAGTHYLEMRLQQQQRGTIGNTMKTNEQGPASGMLPVIPKENYSMQSQQSPVANRKNEVSPYAQMLEKNRQFSVTVNKDQTLKQSRIAEPSPFGTPSMQMNRQNDLSNG